MKDLYTLHQGNIWGLNRISEKDFFKTIGFREGIKVSLSRAWKLEKQFRKRSEKYFQKKAPNKKVDFEMIIYAVVHKAGRAVAEHQIYCDIDLIDKKKEKSRYSNLKKTFTFPQKIKKLFDKYKIALQKEFEKQTKNRVLKGKNDKSLLKVERQLKIQVNQHFPLLQKILLNDKNEIKRADAAWLLLWGDAKGIPRLLLKVLSEDPSSAVANNAGHSLLFLLKEKKVKLKARPIYNLLRRPSTICRNKGAFLLLELIKQNKRIKVPKNIKDLLLKMANSKQPNNSDPAKQILNEIQ